MYLKHRNPIILTGDLHLIYILNAVHLHVINCQLHCYGARYVNGMIIIIAIIITAVKPEDSSPVRMGIKRITARQQARLPNWGVEICGVDSKSLRQGTKVGEDILQGILKKSAESSRMLAENIKNHLVQ